MRLQRWIETSVHLSVLRTVAGATGMISVSAAPTIALKVIVFRPATSRSMPLMLMEQKSASDVTRSALGTATVQ